MSEVAEMCMACGDRGGVNFTCRCGRTDSHHPVANSTQDANGEPLDGPEFELDLSGFDESGDHDGSDEASISGVFPSPPPVTPERRLEELLAPFGWEPVDKARDLVRRNYIEQVKRDGQSTWFHVRGSKLYVVKITSGEDFEYAECTCPNGLARGGEATCYHSIAARVLEAGLAQTWLEE